MPEEVDAMSELFYHRERDEVVGILHSIESSSDGGIVALIDTIPTWLPPELESRIQGLQGSKIGILRLDGYHVRRIKR